VAAGTAPTIAPARHGDLRVTKRGLDVASLCSHRDSAAAAARSRRSTLSCPLRSVCDRVVCAAAERRFVPTAVIRSRYPREGEGLTAEEDAFIRGRQQSAWTKAGFLLNSMKPHGCRKQSVQSTGTTVRGHLFLLPSANSCHARPFGSPSCRLHVPRCGALHVRRSCRRVGLHRPDGPVRYSSLSHATHGVGAEYPGRELHFVSICTSGLVPLVHGLALPGEDDDEAGSDLADDPKRFTGCKGANFTEPTYPLDFHWIELGIWSRRCSRIDCICNANLQVREHKLCPSRPGFAIATSNKPRLPSQRHPTFAIGGLWKSK
jgi:hypothetical protein